MIKITRGDTALLNLKATNGEGDPVALTGAVFSTKIRAADGTNVTFPNGQHTANPDQSGAGKGKFTLQLSISDTNELQVGVNHEVVTKVVISASTIYYRGQILTVIQQDPIT